MTGEYARALYSDSCKTEGVSVIPWEGLAPDVRRAWCRFAKVVTESERFAKVVTVSEAPSKPALLPMAHALLDYLHNHADPRARGSIAEAVRCLTDAIELEKA